MAEDDTLLLVEDGAVVWRREEGLAGVRETLFLDLPATTPELEASFNAERPTLKDRAHAEFLTIKVPHHSLLNPLPCSPLSQPWQSCFDGGLMRSPQTASTGQCKGNRLEFLRWMRLPVQALPGALYFGTCH